VPWEKGGRRSHNNKESILIRHLEEKCTIGRGKKSELVTGVVGGSLESRNPIIFSPERSGRRQPSRKSRSLSTLKGLLLFPGKINLFSLKEENNFWLETTVVSAEKHYSGEYSIL